MLERLTLEAVAFSLLGRAPASRDGVPGSRPARCDGADPGGGLHWCRDQDGVRFRGVSVMDVCQ